MEEIKFEIDFESNPDKFMRGVSRLVASIADKYLEANPDLDRIDLYNDLYDEIVDRLNDNYNKNITLESLKYAANNYPVNQNNVINLDEFLDFIERFSNGE